MQRDDIERHALIYHYAKKLLIPGDPPPCYPAKDDVVSIASRILDLAKELQTVR